MAQHDSAQPPTEQWIAASWRAVETLALPTTDNRLPTVVAVTAANLWAIGIEITSSTGSYSLARSKSSAAAIGGATRLATIGEGQ